MSDHRSVVTRVERRPGVTWLVLLLGLALIAAGLLPRSIDLEAVLSEVETVAGPGLGTPGPVADEDVASGFGADPGEMAGHTDGGPATAAPEPATTQELEALVDAYYAAVGRQDIGEALRLAGDYVRTAPDDAYGYALRGYVHWWRGRCDRAVPDFDRALRIDPTYGYVYWARGNCRFARTELVAAESDARQAERHAAEAGERAYANLLLGWLAYVRDDFAAAREAFARALAEQAPVDGLWPAYWLAEARGGTLDEAALARFAQADPGDRIEAVALQVYLGEREDTVLMQAGGGRALFYLAQLRLLEGREGDAKALLRATMDDGFSADLSFAAARAQLRGLR